MKHSEIMMMAEISSSSSSMTSKGTTRPTTCNSPQNVGVGIIGVGVDLGIESKEFNLIRRMEESNRTEDSPNFNNNNNNIIESTHLNNNFPISNTRVSKNGSRNESPNTTPTNLQSEVNYLSSSQSQNTSNSEKTSHQEINEDDDQSSDGNSIIMKSNLLNKEHSHNIENDHSGGGGGGVDLGKGINRDDPKIYPEGESIPMEEEGDANIKNEVMVIDEDYSQESENEMPVEYEDEDSEKEEHRITVREALMSRAFQTGKYSSSGKYTGSFSGGGNRSGMISPSSSTVSIHQNNHINQDGHFIKSSLNISNGHGGSGGGIARHPSSHSQQISQSHGHHFSTTGSSSSHNRHHQHPHRSSSYGYQQQHNLTSSSRHNHHQNSRYHHQSRQHQLLHDQNEPSFVKSERKSLPSPIQTDLKPDSLGGESSGNLNGIGNALLSLASLGSLAALQQSIPNFMANVAAHSTPGSGGNHHNLPSSLLNTPLNLTNATNNNNNNNSSSPHNNFNPHNVFHSSSGQKQQQQQQHSSSQNSHPLLHPQQLNRPTNNPRNETLSPNSIVANAIASLAGNGGMANFSQSGSSIPQLILASGQISQGIQGAQLLIPTSQGIMSQTVLTIPLTQPGSPVQNSLSPSLQSGSSGGGSRDRQSSAGHHHHQSLSHHDLISGSHKLSNSNRDKGILNPLHPQRSHDQISPPTRVPRSPASPDLPGGALSSPLMSLGQHSHLVSQQLGSHMSTIHEKLVMEHNGGGMNGLRNSHGKRERESCTPGGMNSSSLLSQPKSSPCSIEGSMNDNESDRFSDNDDDQMVEGINLDEIKEFAKAFKLRRLSLGLTQTQVGQALSVTEGPAYSQSAICSALANAWQLAQSQTYPSSSIHQQSMFEKLDITPKSAQKIKPVLERWMKEAEERYKNGHQNLNEFVGMEPSKKRKRRTSFTPQALELLNNHFERNTHPSGAEITTLAHQLGYEREVIRIWFCNKRQALKNTVRMMSKDSSPM